ncbi:unnamed protein product [Bemisia tabaci]|uniref:Meteorin-like protein n=1 Tax=Bemisia tabaci TaxID=7038 RepID=A0A9P0CBU4_BEMTA|nr:unnamed protein product [Bemisia tabaci]
MPPPGGNSVLMAPYKRNKCKNVSTRDLNFNSLRSAVRLCGCINSASVKKCVLLVLCVLQLVSHIQGSIMGEECDWSGSGLPGGGKSGGGRGVTPVYLRCSEGAISWSYPRGALRVLLRLGSTGRDFRGCIKVAPSFAGARLFLEGARSLTPLFTPDDGADPRLVRCFHSSHAQAAIYVESEVGEGPVKMFPKQMAAFSYDLEPLSKRHPGGSVYDITDDCKPCSNEELTQAFCSSDLVVNGWIGLIENKYELEVSEMSVRVAKYLRRSMVDTDEGHPLEAPPDVTERNYPARRDHPNLIDGGEEDEKVLIQVAAHCRIKPSDGGQFIFMARKRLGDYKLVCAPRLSEWKALLTSEAVRNGAHCVLRS